jgi:ABC-type uncharacterized transport system permease subunit
MKDYSKNVLIETSFSGVVSATIFVFLLDILDFFLSLIVSVFVFCCIMFVSHLIWLEKIDYKSELRAFGLLSPMLISTFVGVPVLFAYMLIDSHEGYMWLILPSIFGIIIYLLCFVYLYKKGANH